MTDEPDTTVFLTRAEQRIMDKALRRSLRLSAPLTPNRQLTEEEVRQLKEAWEKMCRGEIISPNPRMHWLQRLLRWWP